MWIRRAFVAGTALCLLLLFFLTGFTIYVRTDKARIFFEERLSALIPGSVSFEALSLLPLDGSFEVQGVVLRGPAGKAVAGCERLFADVSWTASLTEMITFESIRLEKPWARILVDGQGGVNLQQAVTEPKTGGSGSEKDLGSKLPFNVIVRALEFSGGSVTFDMPSKAWGTVAGNISLAASGNLGQKTGNFKLHIDRVHVKQAGREKEITSIGIAARLERNRLSPIRARMRLDASSIDVAGSIDDLFELPRFDLVAELSLVLPGLLEGLDVTPRITGLATGNLSFKGTANDPEATLALHSKGLSLGVFRAKRASILGTFKKRLLTLRQFSLAGEDVTVEGSGALDLAAERIEGHLALESSNIAPVLGSFGSTDISGSALLRVNIGGQMKRPEVFVEVTGKRIQVREHTVGDIHLVGNLDDAGMFQLTTATLANRGALVTGSGHLKIYDTDPSLQKRPPAMDITLDVRDVNLAHFVSERVGQGTLSGNIHLFGNMNAPRVKVRLGGKDMAIHGIPVGALDGAAELENGVVYLDGLTIHQRTSAIQIAGSLDLFSVPGLKLLSDPAFTLKVTGTSILVQDFMDDAKGGFTVSAQLKGHLSKPVGWLTLEGKELEVGGQALDGITLKATAEGERLLIRTAQLTVVPGETIAASGWISMDASYNLAVVSRGVSLARIDYFENIGMTAGTFQCDLSGSGSWQDPRASGKIMFENMQLLGKPLESVRLDIGIENHRTHFATKASYETSGTYHLLRHDFSLSARFRETDLGPYFELADKPDFSGTVTGSLDAHGNSDTPADIEADCDIQALALFWRGNDLLRTGHLKAMLKKGHLNLLPVDLELGKGGTLRLGGAAVYSGSLDLQAKGEIPLTALQPFIEDTVPDLKGRLILAANVKGTYREPRIEATVDLSQVAFTVPGLMQKVDNGEGRLRVVPGRVEVEYLRGRLDAGRFDLSGGVDVAAFRPQKIRLHLTAEALPVNVPETLGLLLNADLVMDGTPEQAMIQGDVVLLEGNYHKDVQINLLNMATRRERLFTPPPEQPHPFFKNTALNISIKRRENLVVDNNVARLEINPDLRITGKLGHPVIRGRATVETGTLTYRKKTFQVKKGYVDFSNPYSTEPYIDIEGETKVRGWIITLALAGTPDALSFKLTSDPPEAEGDILSLLLIGRTTRELSAGEAGTAKSPAQLLAEVMVGTLGEDLKSATGLDTLEVTMGDEDSADTVKVTVGKDLSRRMSIKYATESKEGLLIQRAIAEYRLLEHFLVSGSQDTNGIFGGEVKFRLEFR